MAQINEKQALPSSSESNCDISSKLTPEQIQQEYFENLPDYDWVKYENHDRKYVLQNVAFALFGSPTVEGDMALPQDSDNVQLEGYTSRQKEQAMKVYNKLCTQCKFSQNDQDLYMSVILIVCAKPNPIKFYQIEPSDYWVNLHKKNDIIIWCTAVFRIRKCVPTVLGAKSCKIYIDENARVYQSWESYLSDNVLPKCVIIAPEHGEYEGVIDENEKKCSVKLTVTPSPSLGLKAKVLDSVDKVSTVATIGTLGVIGAALFTPVAPVVLAGAAVATVSTGLYGIARSSLHLHDRRVHEQTISPTDGEARGSWLNIAASSVGLTAGAASSLLAKSATTGTNLTKTGQALAVSVEILRHANIVTGGIGVLNSLIHIIVKYKKHGEKPTTLELFQFSAATLFFCQAVVSNRTAANIVEEAQANAINEYRTTLRSNRHRKIFDKISSETRRVNGAVQGNVEVIRGIKNIVNKDQYFADVLKINKDVNQHKLRISMTSDGQVKLNAVHRFNPTDLYNMGKESRAQLFTSLGPATVTSPNVKTGLLTATSMGPGYIEKEDEGNLLVGIHPGEIIRIGSLFIRVSAAGAENIALLLEDLSQDVYNKLMTVACNVLSHLLPEEISKIRLLSPDEDLISQVVNFVFNYLRRQRPLGQECNDDNCIVIALKQFFQDGIVRKDTIIQLKNSLLKWVNDEIDERRIRYPNKILIRCPTCDGVRYA